MVVLFLFGLILSSCGTSSIPQQSPLDTSENHYARGLIAVENGDLIEAHRSFEHARLLDSDYPGAFVGFALIKLKQSNFHEARQQLEMALRRDRNFVGAHIALGRIVSIEGIETNRSVDNWLPESLRAFHKAEQLDPQNSEVNWYRANAYLLADDLVSARNALTQILDLNRGDWVERAMMQVERIQMIERAAPGSDMGKQIGLKDAITRGEVAVLLVEELKIGELIQQRGSTDVDSSVDSRDIPRPPDLENAWARMWVEEVLALGIHGLRPFPDGTFHPNEPITRAHYAVVNLGVLVLLSGDRGLTTRYIGEASRFPDLRADHYTYNAAALSTERGIMQVDRRTGAFRPDEGVSGAEALVIIRELQNAFRMEY
jgi:tetratricopeptide (TPR) repeat protein